jgi:hypothetical protein
MRPLLAAAVVVAALMAPTRAASAGADVWTAEGAILQPAQGVVVSPDPCAGLNDDTSACIQIDGVSGAILATVETGAPIDDALVSRPWIVRVYEVVAEGWSLVLSTQADDLHAGPLYADVVPETRDVTGDGQPELVLGYRSEGTGQILELDVVELTDTGHVSVLGHSELYKGTVVLKPGRILTWTPEYKTTDGNCCPTWIRRDVVRFEDGQLVVREGKKVRTEAARIPAGDF